MNNGKVRIYELSRELNLDNKDLLAVCEQLSISVKSHSSTITDSEAELIRTAAEKYTANRPSPAKSAPSRNGANSQAAEAKAKAAAPVQKKQQILEIRKPIIRQAPSPEPPQQPSPSAPQPVAIDPPAMPANPAPPRPSGPSRPAHPATANAPAIDAAIRPEPAIPSSEPLTNESVDDLDDSSTELESNTKLESVQEAPLAPSEAPIEATPAVASSSSNISQPELSGPPARPAPPSASINAQRVNLTNRPLLKRARSEQVPQTVNESVEPAGRTDSAVDSPPRVPRPAAPVNRAPGPVRPTDPRSAPKPQTIVELRRPPRPVRPGEGSVESSRPTEGVVLRVNRPNAPSASAPTAPGATASPDALLQARPTLPRAKKAKSWQEEEEEGREAEKAAKVAGKTKRRTQVSVEDEDEDIDSLLNKDGDAAAPVSLSLVRPAKPKSTRVPQVKAPTAAPRAKRASGGSRDRRDRREQEVKVEKPTTIVLHGGLTVQELSSIMSIPDTDIIRTLFMKGIAATVTQTLDIATATMVAQELGVEVETGQREAEAKKITEMIDADDLEKLQRRPPVVTIMGHVDHGKTTLLDAIRKTKVAQGEAGGITQHIGAYHVDVEHEGQMQQVVFLDTPGHEAFTAMRARGARVTDIAILVVAADDGVRPQTIEAISHAKAAEVPIIVAINKVDKEEAQPDRVKQELTEYGLVPEEWGGDTVMVAVSAISGENLDTLLEMILLVSEVEDLYANPDRSARGTVIEAHLDKAKGPVATLLIQNGTLRVGDTIVAGSALGKVRAMVDDRGQRVKQADPSFAVEVLGLGDVPAAGDDFQVFDDEKEARSVASDKTDEQRQSRLLQAMSSRRVSLNTLSARAQEGELKELNLVLKADVQGSVEALLGALKQLPQNEVQVRVLYAAPGEISETDVDLAAASDAVMIGFNTTLATGARQAADRAGVDVREYNIIYALLDDIQAAMEGLLEPELIEEALGQAEVRAVFPVGRGAVAGCYVQSGKIVRNCKVRIRRGNEVVYEGNLDSLKRMKEDAREVNSGYECGIGIDSFNAWKESDVIEAYRMITKRRTLSPK
ncbi:translation initiation factor IF-2 [Leptolyngbya sp. FACHB-321]|uniref:translation initiation factor IF-2 n=1 Tax=Leptolyngbya sp. FACHB-321 TaxID=2692807 RepID=UPI001684A30E|nr:translation initiation factor IF-2 [Leptolyngbya sp. FACHB-321]MBD2035548.1 translation initiation factor IF-2 [Leptolyngbya sp. FACHB-321]